MCARGEAAAGAELIFSHLCTMMYAKLSSGLDPAFPLYMFNGPSARLSASDAKFVDVIHTDGGILGYPWPLGHADFFPNGGTALQPGCRRQDSSRNQWFGFIGEHFTFSSSSRLCGAVSNSFFELDEHSGMQPSASLGVFHRVDSPSESFFDITLRAVGVKFNGCKLR